jgi:hypothetical protein
MVMNNAMVDEQERNFRLWERFYKSCDLSAKSLIQTGSMSNKFRKIMNKLLKLTVVMEMSLE